MNKLTFIAFNDLHWRGSNPEARTDNYMLALKAKLLEIAQLAHDLDAEGVLIAGDLVDVPGISLPVLTELDYALGKIPCPVFCIAGQHDEWDHSPDSLSRAPFGHLRRLEYIVDVTQEAVTFPIGSYLVDITGRHYDSEVDTEDYYEPILDPNAITFDERQLIKIHLAHGLVIDKAPGFEMKHTTLDSLKTSANILCVGDYHPGIGVPQLNNKARTIVVNPGALGRVKASMSDINRRVQVAIIYVWEDGRYTAHLHTLKSAKPGNEVLSREKIEAEKTRDDKVSEYLRLLQTGSRRNLNTIEMMTFIADKEGLPQKVKSEALKRLGIARESRG